MMLLIIFFLAKVVDIHLVLNPKHKHHAAPSQDLGVDARCSVLLGYLCPSASIDQLFPNKVAGQHLCDLVAVCMDNVMQNRTKFLA